MSTSISPWLRHLIAARFWWSVSLNGRPISCPGATARARPSPVRGSNCARTLQAAKHSQHGAAVRCRGVGPCRKRSETSLLPGDRRERVQEVAGGSRQSVEPHYRYHVASGELSEQSGKPCPVRLGSARHFAEHFSCTTGAQLTH